MNIELIAIVAFTAGFFTDHVIGVKIAAEAAKLEVKLKADFEAVVKDIKAKV